MLQLSHEFLKCYRGTGMRAVVQRVSKASVAVEGGIVGEIGPGLVVLLGVGRSDTKADAEYLAEKIAALRPLRTLRAR